MPGQITTDARGRKRINLGKGHPAANSGGWQYLSRFRVWQETGAVLRTDEHVHHLDDDKTNDEPENLEVRLAEYHGRYHATHTVLRDWKGRFAERSEPEGPFPAPRYAAIIGPAALGCAP